jgi:peptidoglycan/xylan/chitin deacetylase (PgdA/CDA1 family)
MNGETPTGRMFTREDLDELVCEQHEVACHTYDHCDAWVTTPAVFESSIRRNQEALASLLPNIRAVTLSYPVSYPRPGTKRRVQKHFAAARGGGQTYNAGRVDFNYLSAFFLEQSRHDLNGIRRVIDAAAAAPAWLIFATHDVCDSPTRFGCTPQLFGRVVDYALKSGARILPVGEALQLIP